MSTLTISPNAAAMRFVACHATPQLLRRHLRRTRTSSGRHTPGGRRQRRFGCKQHGGSPRRIIAENGGRGTWSSQAWVVRTFADCRGRGKRGQLPLWAARSIGPLRLSGNCPRFRVPADRAARRASRPGKREYGGRRGSIPGKRAGRGGDKEMWGRLRRWKTGTVTALGSAIDWTSSAERKLSPFSSGRSAADTPAEQTAAAGMLTDGGGEGSSVGRPRAGIGEPPVSHVLAHRQSRRKWHAKRVASDEREPNLQDSTCCYHAGRD